MELYDDDDDDARHWAVAHLQRIQLVKRCSSVSSASLAGPLYPPRPIVNVLMMFWGANRDDMKLEAMDDQTW